MIAGDSVTHIADHAKSCADSEHGKVRRIFERKDTPFIHKFAEVSWPDGTIGKHPVANLFPCSCELDSRGTIVS